MKRGALIAGAALSIGLAAGGGASAWHYKSKWPINHALERHLIVQHEAQQIPAGSILLAGDSLIEMQYAPALCGMATLNAGIAGSAVADWLPILPDIIARSKPSRVVINLGMNDATKARLTPIDQWSASFERLLDDIGNRPTLILGVPPVEAGKEASDQIDLEHITAINIAARRIAAKRGLRFSEPPKSVDGETLDGVHYNRVGSSRFGKRLAGICSA